jgi:hypothetical protein
MLIQMEVNRAPMAPTAKAIASTVPSGGLAQTVRARSSALKWLAGAKWTTPSLIVLPLLTMGVLPIYTAWTRNYGNESW